MTAISHIGRLAGVFWTLARYGAFDPLRERFNLPAVFRLVPVRGDMRALRPGERLARALTDLGPGFVKIGQALATRPDIIGAGMAADLALLQDRLEPFPAEDAIRTIEEDLERPLSDLFDHFDAVPVAAASIAQVHKAVTKDGRVVAVKVRRPGIEARFARDIAAFRFAAAHLEKRIARSRRLRPVDVIDRLSETISREMDFRREGAATEDLAERSAKIPGYRIPKVDWQRTGRRVLTLDWVEGIGIRDLEALKSAGHDPKRLSRVIVTAFLHQVTESGFFHADLHQGNLLVDAEGIVVALDFGITGRLSVNERRFLAEILHGFVTRNYKRIAEVHFEAGYVPKDQDMEEFALALRAIGEPIMGMPVRAISAGKLLAQLFETTARFQMKTQPQLLLLQKTMVTVEGLALHLDPDINMWEISGPLMRDWMARNSGPRAYLSGLARIAELLARRLPGFIEALERRLGPDADPQPDAKG